MPTIFSHAIAAAAGGKAFFNNQLQTKVLITGMICAAIPDADVISFQFGIPYESMCGHRGITHSIFFSFLLAVLVLALFFNSEKPFSRTWNKLYIYFFLVTVSHPVLDAMTNGGRGVAFFAPFSNERYFFPFQPIHVSPIGVSHFFTHWGFQVLKSEFKWVVIPSIMLWVISSLLYKKKAGEN